MTPGKRSMEKGKAQGNLIQAEVHRLLFGEGNPEATIYEERARLHLSRGSLAGPVCSAPLWVEVRKEFMLRVRRDCSGRHCVRDVPALYLFLIRLLGEPWDGERDFLPVGFVLSPWFQKAIEILVDEGWVSGLLAEQMEITAKGRKMVTKLKEELGP